MLVSLCAAALAVAQAAGTSAGQEAPFETGIASWYGDPFHGRLSASGELFDKTAMTAAHKTLPFGSIVLVKNLDNGSQVQVRINDRGPFIAGRIIDLSEAAARVIGLDKSGTARVALYLVAPGSQAAAYVSIQVASFSVEANAKLAFDKVSKLGFTVRYERVRNFIRVLVVVPKAELDASLSRLRRAGFSSFVVRDSP